MPPNDIDGLLDDALASLSGTPMNDEVLFKKIVLNHVKNAKERSDRQETEMREFKSSLEVLRNDMTVLKDNLIGLEDKKISALEKQVDELKAQMTRVYAIAGFASLIGGWLLPLVLKKIF